MAAPMRMACSLRFNTSGLLLLCRHSRYLCTKDSNVKNDVSVAADNATKQDTFLSSQHTSTGQSHSESSTPPPTNQTGDDTQHLDSSSGLSKAFDMFERVSYNLILKEQKPEILPDTGENFATLMRNSKLMQLGDPSGRVVVGSVIEVIDDDIYVDFGGKFHCVCKRPRLRAKEYTKGAKVRIRLNDLELSSHFLGATRHVTLLEADGTLLGLYHPSPQKQS